MEEFAEANPSLFQPGRNFAIHYGEQKENWIPPSVRDKAQPNLLLEINLLNHLKTIAIYLNTIKYICIK